MVEIQNNIAIDASRKYVFDFLADFENIPRWNYYVRRVSKLTPGSVSVGTRYHQIRKNDEQEFRISSFKPERFIKIETTNDSNPEFIRSFKLTEGQGHTFISDNFRLETKYPSFVERLMADKIHSAVYSNLQKLKVLLETGQIRLQDGRLIKLDQSG